MSRRESLFEGEPRLLLEGLEALRDGVRGVRLAVGVGFFGFLLAAGLIVLAGGKSSMLPFYGIVILAAAIVAGVLYMLAKSVARLLHGARLLSEYSPRYRLIRVGALLTLYSLLAALLSAAIAAARGAGELRHIDPGNPLFAVFALSLLAAWLGVVVFSVGVARLRRYHPWFRDAAIGLVVGSTFIALVFGVVILFSALRTLVRAIDETIPRLREATAPEEKTTTPTA